MKRIITVLTVCSLCLTAAHAQNEEKKWWEDIKQNTTFGGYVVGKAAFNDQDLDSKNKVTVHSISV